MTSFDLSRQSRPLAAQAAERDYRAAQHQKGCGISEVERDDRT
jgi:hypothetical protein